MATAGHGDDPPLPPLLTDPQAPAHDGDHSASDTASESGSSYIGSAQPDTPICPYQSSRFFDQECSRYFDCPTHLVERALSDQSDRPDDHHNDQPAFDESIDASQPEPRLPSPPQMVAGHGEHQPESPRAQSPEAASPVDPATHAQPADLPRSPSPPDSQPEAHDPPAEAPTEVAATVAGGDHAGLVPSPPARQNTHSQVSGQLMTLEEALNDMGISTSSAQDAAGPSATPSLRSTSGLPGSPIHPDPRSASSASTSQGSRSRRQREIPLPRWQPDAEVTLCPICNTQFNIFIRKHHCRKCGRVVCARCSPHRITIPHPYIVRPPGEATVPYQPAHRGEGGIADFTSASGGESVRLCNPCVPDPNTTPPQTQHSAAPFSRAIHHRSQSASSRDWNVNDGRTAESPVVRYPANNVGMGLPADSVSRSRSATVSSRPHGLPSRLSQEAWAASRSSAYYGGQSTSRGLSQVSMLRPHSFFGGPSTEASSSRGEMSSVMNRPLPPAPQIAEEDECPVCHHELPSRELENFEALREAHINQCIASHSAYSGPPRNLDDAATHGTPPPRTARRTGIFPYTATEKDCVDDAECTICLEEFQVGVSMARLECLCRFHRSCISAWFVDHPGRCPVHQHDSFGY